MSTLPDAIWLDTSPSLQCFAQPLLSSLSHQITIARWQYYQTQDEANSLDVAVKLLYEYLQSCNRPVHLMGHSTGGLVGLLFTRQYPELVKSLTLLAVGVDAAVDWQAHYYMHRPFLSRDKTLSNFVYNLFGYQNECTIKRLASLLEQDLDCGLSPHSLFKRFSLPPSSVPVPLMVCGSSNDIIVEPDALEGWLPYLKISDRVWECPEGRHFFHFLQTELVVEQILNFWKSLRPLDTMCVGVKS